MEFVRTPIPDVVVIEPKIFGDDRGFFMETWNVRDFSAKGLNATFVQDNQSRSTGNTLRGLHYQLKRPQGKLVRAVWGEIFDVAVDLRKNSPFFGKWVGAYLSAENKRMFWVPAGFAHGFCVTSDWADVVYKCTDFYAPEYEKTVIWNDPDLAINWPLKGEPILSKRDAGGILFKNAECY